MIKQGYELKKIQKLDDVLETLLPTYSKANPRDTIIIHSKLPSNEEITKLCISFEEILFPGYRTRVLNGDDRFKLLLGKTLDEIYDILYDQVSKSLPFRWASEYAKTKNVLSPNEIELETEFIVNTVLEKLPIIRGALKQDVLAAYNGDPAAKSYAEIILSYPGLRAIAIYRIAHEFYKFNVPLIPRMMTEYAHSETGIDIHPGAQICEGFFIDHGTGVVIGETCRIGNRVKLYQGVTLGAKSFPLDADGNPIKGIKRHPDIEDDVIIYAGATILGGDTVIGKGSVIGGNVWVTESIPPYSVVVQKHAEIEIRNTNHTEKVAET
ncbi:serine acetyltransferase [Candidatus Poribacteria bacterium]|nr:serine acetyltransferase [Candidatus Poribacteria bacterium]